MGKPEEHDFQPRQKTLEPNQIYYECRKCGADESQSGQTCHPKWVRYQSAQPTPASVQQPHAADRIPQDADRLPPMPDRAFADADHHPLTFEDVVGLVCFLLLIFVIVAACIYLYSLLSLAYFSIIGK
jgi:hypothetical protein